MNEVKNDVVSWLSASYRLNQGPLWPPVPAYLGGEVKVGSESCTGFRILLSELIAPLVFRFISGWKWKRRRPLHPGPLGTNPN
jgi:hypothetical protein